MTETTRTPEADATRRRIAIIVGGAVVALALILGVTHFASGSSTPPVVPAAPGAPSVSPVTTTTPTTSLPSSGGTRDPFSAP